MNITLDTYGILAKDGEHQQFRLYAIPGALSEKDEWSVFAMMEYTELDTKIQLRVRGSEAFTEFYHANDRS